MYLRLVPKLIENFDTVLFIFLVLKMKAIEYKTLLRRVWVDGQPVFNSLDP